MLLHACVQFCNGNSAESHCRCFQKLRAFIKLGISMPRQAIPLEMTSSGLQPLLLHLACMPCLSSGLSAQKSEE